jgi:hypothetical protein
MKTISRKELTTLISHIDNKSVKEKIESFLDCDEVDLEEFFNKIKELELDGDTDYKLFLLLEEFYLKFKDK